MNIEYINTVSVTDYNNLRSAVGWSRIINKHAEKGLKNSVYITAARDGDKTVGMSRIISDGGYVYFIADVIVLPEYQGRGIGRTLMNNIMGFIKNNLEENETVYVALMASKGKENFYDKFGFSARPDDYFGAGMTQWVTKGK